MTGISRHLRTACVPMLALALLGSLPTQTFAQVSLDSPAAAGKRIVRDVQVVFKGAATMDAAAEHEGALACMGQWQIGNEPVGLA